jgi:membrane associated rhomboid family serine protease
MNDIISNKILLFALLICSINIMLFFLVPSFGYTLNLSQSLSEPWRFLTFQFFHVDIIHLLENVIGMLFIALIAIELNIDFKSFFMVYFISVFIVILPITVFFPMSTVAGNSTGVYGLFALCLVKARKLIPSKITVPIMFLFIFSNSIFNYTQCGYCFLQFFSGEMFHLTGFLAGMTLTLANSKPKSLLKL